MKKTAVASAQPDLLNLGAIPTGAKQAASLPAKASRKAKPKNQIVVAKTVKTAPAASTAAQQPVSQPSMLELIGKLATDPHVDAAKMQQILDMQFRIEAREAERQFNEAMAACMQELPIVIKDKKGEKAGHKYAPLEKIAIQCMPIIYKHGFAPSWGTAESHLPNHYRVTCRLAHRGGHVEHYQADLEVDDKGPAGNKNKTTIQGFGSTMSYGQRYLTKMIFNITIAGEDNDGAQSKKPTADQDTAPSGEALISQKQEDEIRDLLEAHNVPSAAFLKWAGIEKISDLPAYAYDQSIVGIKEYGKSANRKK